MLTKTKTSECTLNHSKNFSSVESRIHECHMYGLEGDSSYVSKSTLQYGVKKANINDFNLKKTYS